jgi:hypothetical protein
MYLALISRTRQPLLDTVEALYADSRRQNQRCSELGRVTGTRSATPDAEDGSANNNDECTKYG